MLVSEHWLNEYVNTQRASAKELAEKITIAGNEVDAVHDMADGVSGVVIGYVETCGKHPNADKLSLCTVDIGGEDPVQIVCGAPNVAAGEKVAVAKQGAVLPGNMKIKKSKLRGETSNGMICSLKELGIEDKLVPQDVRDGIYVFPDDVPVGEDAIPYLNLDDHILELDLTPNRADCLNMIGVAYEVGAILDQPVTLPEPRVNESKTNTQDLVSVQIEDEADTPYYGARMIRNVRIASSPRWLQNRLIAAGIRPINNVVDITNYVLMEYGQPLHAFDFDRLGSNQILTRRAKDGETIETLDGQERPLSNDHLVITNGKTPVAIAGVMGGATSEVTKETTTVLLEAAYFDAGRVRRAATDLDLHSDASQRYERGIDPNRVIAAADRAAQLLAELADGEALSGLAEAGKRTWEPKTIAISAEKINRVLGTALSNEMINDIFRRLGFSGEQGEGIFHVTVPTRRMDITIAEDLIEEVGRMYGYDHLPTTLPYGNTTPGLLTDRQKKLRKIRRFLEGAGLYEAVTYSLTTPEKAKQYTDYSKDYHAVALPRPMSQDHRTLRMSLTPQLLEAAQYNLNHKVTDIALYEIGPVFLSEETEPLIDLPEEKEKLAAVLTGVWDSHPWQQEKTSVDFYTAKGVLDSLFAELGLSDRVKYTQTKKDGLHPGRTATVMLDRQPIGFIGQIHPTQAQTLDLGETYVFEIDLEVVFAATVTLLSYQPMPRFPSITRDIALVVDEEVAAANVASAIRQAGGSLLKRVAIFDVYQGEHLEEGKKSLAFSLEYYNPEKTLTDDEVENIHGKVVHHVKDIFGAELRS